MSSVASKSASRMSSHFVVLDASKTFRTRLGEKRSMQVSKKKELSNVLSQITDKTVWIMAKSDWTKPLLEAVSFFGLQQQKRMNFGDLLMLEAPVQPDVLPSLHSQFRRVVGEVSNFRILPLDQLAEVLASKNKTDLFIGGIVDHDANTITLARGDLTTVNVPLSIFNMEGPCKPDFNSFELDDYGYTLRFGKYEASAHSVLYRVDPAYRRRANRQRIAEEQGFGPSLRRLRILRRLSRDDFPNISSKTIARIERGETEKPQGKTLETLAKVLNVAPEEIETY
jgi:hypothetical protein